MIFKYSVLFLLFFEPNSSAQKYKGESFPKKYLQAEDVVPEYSDVEYYLQGLNMMLGQVELEANDTDINRALGTFLMKAILKRTIKENKNKMQEEQQKLMNSVLLRAENIMSHYLYFTVRGTTWDDPVKRVSELYKDEELQIDAIENYNRNRLQKWILSDVKLNNFAKEMDEMKMPRTKYLKFIEDSVPSEEYTVNVVDSGKKALLPVFDVPIPKNLVVFREQSIPVSYEIQKEAAICDYCLSQIIYNPKPLDTNTLRPCVAEEFCAEIVYHRAPSFAYTLSHRMLNVMFPRHIRRCYMRSPEEDDELIDILCSSMYRETVYIARRGYFNRDMWMEHIALCAFYGYEEFHRRHWFRKVMSWIDDQGCLSENFNTDANRTAYRLTKEDDPEEQNKIRKRLKKARARPCHWHQMAVGLVLLGHAVRHAVHFSEMDKLKDEL